MCRAWHVLGRGMGATRGKGRCRMGGSGVGGEDAARRGREGRLLFWEGASASLGRRKNCCGGAVQAGWGFEVGLEA